MKQISDEDQLILNELNAKGWWQGSLIHRDSIPNTSQAHSDCEWWIIASQACNIYNDNFDTVPVIELIGASKIPNLSNDYANGSNPRKIHLTASGENQNLLLLADSQKRLWIPRKNLCEIEAPQFKLENQYTQPFSNKDLWLDKFSSWLSRGYTRIALPDEFNVILGQSKIREEIDKLAKRSHLDLYGVFLTITSDEDGLNKEIGALIGPYDLEILVACYEDVDPLPIKTQLVQRLFSDKVKAPGEEDQTITRSDLARKLGIRIFKESVDVRSVSNITMSELLVKNTIRYNLVDFHSVADSSQL
ncbi:hypothetical protein [Pseudaeromonas pectinilytica]